MNQTPQKSIETLIAEETEKRLNEMGSPDYQFPKKLGKTDAAIILAAIAVSAVLIILCTTGVIL